MCAFGTIEGPVGALCQLITTPYREGSRCGLPGASRRLIKA